MKDTFLVDQDIESIARAYLSDLQRFHPPELAHLTVIWTQLKDLISSMYTRAQYLDVLSNPPTNIDLSRCPWLGDVIEEEKPLDQKKPVPTKEKSVMLKGGTKEPQPNPNSFKGRVLNIDAECRKETLDLTNRNKLKGAAVDVTVPSSLEAWLQEQGQRMCGASGLHETLWMKLWDQVNRVDYEIKVLILNSLELSTNFWGDQLMQTLRNISKSMRLNTFKFAFYTRSR